MKLSLTERNALENCEQVIEHGLHTFVEVGNALLRIRDERLYRATHKTFEEYCRERWHWTHRHANRQIEAAEVVRNLGPMGPTLENERQARELAVLLPDEQREVWSKALEKTNGRVTTGVLKQVIEATARSRGIVLPEDEPQETEEERARHAEWKRETAANSEYNHKVFQFVNAIEVLSRPPIPLEEAGEEIAKMDTPDKDWCGRAPLAVQNLKQLIRGMKS